MERNEKETKRLIFESSLQDRKTAALIHEQKNRFKNAFPTEDSFEWSDTDDEEEENNEIDWWDLPIKGSDEVAKAQREMEKRIFGNLI